MILRNVLRLLCLASLVGNVLSAQTLGGTISNTQTVNYLSDPYSNFISSITYSNWQWNDGAGTIRYFNGTTKTTYRYIFHPDAEPTPSGSTSTSLTVRASDNSIYFLNANGGSGSVNTYIDGNPRIQTTQSCFSETYYSTPPAGWVVIGEQSNAMYLCKYVGGDGTLPSCATYYYGIDNILAGISPLPPNWVIVSESSLPGSSTVNYGIVYVGDAPANERVQVLSISPIPTGWVQDGSAFAFDNFVYFYIKNTNPTTNLQPTIIAPGSNPYTTTSGNYVTFDALAQDLNTNPALTYKWDFGDGSKPVVQSTSQTAHQYNTNGATTEFNVTLTVWDSEGYSGQKACSVIVTPAGVAPAITTQPQSVTTTSGAYGTLSVVATGSAPLYYQWYENGQMLVGETGSSLTAQGSPIIEGNSYNVRVTNSVGTVMSTSAFISVGWIFVPRVLPPMPPGKIVQLPLAH